MATGNFILDALVKRYPSGRSFDKAVEGQERNVSVRTFRGGDSAANVNPLALYKSAYRQTINPGATKSGTCEYCLRSNGRVFKGSDIVMPDGTVGHHPNCACIFTIANDAPVKKGIYTGADFGARKQLRTNSNALDNVSTSDLRTLAKKRGLKTGGISNAKLRKNILKDYIGK